MNATEALICAKASEAIYNGEEISRAAIEPFGFSNLVLIDLSGVFKDVCAFVASSPDYNLLVFRGTKVFQDWMTDLACSPVRFEWIFTGGPSIGEIHAGFGHCLSDGLQTINSELEKRDATKPLIVTGHSLGGALAALVAACFTVYGPTVRSVSGVYTFGQPRIGLHDFCNTYDRILAGRLVRFVNKDDLVPRVPFRGWDYSDEGSIIHFDPAGRPAVQTSQWQGFLARTFQSFADFGEIITHLGVDVGDHSMTGYRTAVEGSRDTLSGLLN